MSTLFQTRSILNADHRDIVGEQDALLSYVEYGRSPISPERPSIMKIPQIRDATLKMEYGVLIGLKTTIHALAW